MCLSIPGKVAEIKNGEITIDYVFEKRKVNLCLVDNLKLGDYVIVSNKIIVTKVPEKKAREFLEIVNVK